MNSRDIGGQQRATLMILGLIVIIGLVIRVICLPYIYAPFPADAQYYYHVAKNIAEGRGVTADYAWIYARGVPDTLPMPANGYWMPGMSFYLVPWFKLFGPTLFVAKVANLTLGVIFLILIWWVGRELTGNEGAALLGTALAAVDPLFVAGSTTPDASIPQGLFAAGSLLCMYYGLRKKPGWLAVAGLLAGGTHFMRNDGVLVMGVFVLYFIVAVRGGWNKARPAHLLYFFVPYILVVAPWMIRNAVVFGSPSPPNLWRLVILPKYIDIFRTDLSTITLDEFLSRHHGWLGVLRYDVLVLYRIAEWMVLKGGNLLLLFVVPFLWLRRPPVARPYLYMFGALVFVYAFVLPEVGIKGSYTRSFPSLYPILFPGAAAGIWMAGEWVARRWHAVSRSLAVAILGTAVVGYGFARMGLLLTRQHGEVSVYPYIATGNLLRAFFGKHGTPDQVIITEDPWCLNWVTGRKCAMMPAEGIETALAVARRLNARYVVMPGQYRKTYPGFLKAVEDGTLTSVRQLPTLAVYGGVQIYDLWLTEGRRLNTEGMRAAKRGDFEAAIRSFESAAKLVAEYPKPRRVLAENLTKARYDYGRQLELAGKLRAALRNYRLAEKTAPSNWDISDLVARRRALEARLTDATPDA